MVDLQRSLALMGNQNAAGKRKSTFTKVKDLNGKSLKDTARKVFNANNAKIAANKVTANAAGAGVGALGGAISNNVKSKAGKNTSAFFLGSSGAAGLGYAATRKGKMSAGERISATAGGAVVGAKIGLTKTVMRGKLTKGALLGGAAAGALKGAGFTNTGLAIGDKFGKPDSVKKKVSKSVSRLKASAKKAVK